MNKKQEIITKLKEQVQANHYVNIGDNAEVVFQAKTISLNAAVREMIKSGMYAMYLISHRIYLPNTPATANFLILTPASVSKEEASNHPEFIFEPKA